MLVAAQIDLLGAQILRGGAHRRVGVHKIEPFVLHAFEQRGTGRCLDRVPSHVRHDIGIQQIDGTADQSKSFGGVCVLVAALEHDLLAHAHAQHRAAGTQTVEDDAVARHLAQAGHAGGERADAGHDHAVRLKRCR